MSGPEEWNATTERLVAATEDAREVIREARGATRDLRQLVAETRRMIASEVEATLKKQLVASVRDSMEQVGTATRDAMDEAVRRVNAKFDELEAILTGSDPKSRRQGRPSLEELIRVAGTDAPAAFQRRTHL